MKLTVDQHFEAILLSCYHHEIRDIYEQARDLGSWKRDALFQEWERAYQAFWAYLVSLDPDNDGDTAYHIVCNYAALKAWFK